MDDAVHDHLSRDVASEARVLGIVIVVGVGALAGRTVVAVPFDELMRKRLIEER
ncbi:MAG: hypothetical protein PUE49_03425 [Eggerthellales bacterium]|nr:hypothetical protein [Eggerthellales bacterium]